MGEAVKWEDLSDNAREDMEFLGEFLPTMNFERKQIKGWMADSFEGGRCKVYLDSRDLRQLANSCNEVAEWLDKRAELSK